MSNNIDKAAQRYIESHQTGGMRWPDAAEYAVKYNIRDNQGWMQNSQAEFFLNRADLDQWIEDQKDRHIAYQAYEWDLGPNPLPGVNRNVDRLTPTLAERLR